MGVTNHLLNGMILQVINLIAGLLNLRSNSKGSLFLGEELAPETNSSHLKIDGWKIAFLFFWMTSFQVRSVGFREGTAAVIYQGISFSGPKKSLIFHCAWNFCKKHVEVTTVLRCLDSIWLGCFHNTWCLMFEHFLVDQRSLNYAKLESKSPRFWRSWKGYCPEIYQLAPEKWWLDDDPCKAIVFFVFFSPRGCWLSVGHLERQLHLSSKNVPLTLTKAWVKWCSCDSVGASPAQKNVPCAFYQYTHITYHLYSLVIHNMYIYIIYIYICICRIWIIFRLKLAL